MQTKSTKNKHIMLIACLKRIIKETYKFRFSEYFLTCPALIQIRLEEMGEMMRVWCRRKYTSLGSPHNLRRWKSDSGTTIPGASLSAPLGFVGT
jgi:hypothetical protein